MSDGVGPSLSQYLRTVLQSIRNEERYLCIASWTLAKTTSTNDFYEVPATMTSGAAYFSGSVGWRKTNQKEYNAGGWHETCDVVITASKDCKASVSGENIYLVVEGISVKPSRIIDAADTNEIVIYCDKYQP
jgi:hypothetical protein